VSSIHSTQIPLSLRRQAQDSEKTFVITRVCRFFSRNDLYLMVCTGHTDGRLRDTIALRQSIRRSHRAVDGTPHSPWRAIWPRGSDEPPEALALREWGDHRICLLLRWIHVQLVAALRRSASERTWDSDNVFHSCFRLSLLRWVWHVGAGQRRCW
jgi:hypothetical protein